MLSFWFISPNCVLTASHVCLSAECCQRPKKRAAKYLEITWRVRYITMSLHSLHNVFFFHVQTFNTKKKKSVLSFFSLACSVTTVSESWASTPLSGSSLTSGPFWPGEFFFFFWVGVCVWPSIKGSVSLCSQFHCQLWGYVIICTIYLWLMQSEISEHSRA